MVREGPHLWDKNRKSLKEEKINALIEKQWLKHSTENIYLVSYF